MERTFKNPARSDTRCVTRQRCDWTCGNRLWKDGCICAANITGTTRESAKILCAHLNTYERTSFSDLRTV
nr:unnamed protein product [Callosobruchus analis]